MLITKTKTKTKKTFNNHDVSRLIVTLPEISAVILGRKSDGRMTGVERLASHLRLIVGEICCWEHKELIFEDFEILHM